MNLKVRSEKRVLEIKDELCPDATSIIIICVDDATGEQLIMAAPTAKPVADVVCSLAKATHRVALASAANQQKH